MSSQSTMDLKTEYNNFGVSIVFSKSHPFPKKLLADSLEEFDQGPGAVNEIGFSRPTEPPKLTINNGESTVFYFDNDGILTIIAPDPNVNKIRTSLESVQQALQDGIGVEEDEISSVDIQLEARYWKGDDTMPYFEEIYDGIQVNDIFGSEGKPSGIRYVSNADLSDSNESFDLRVEPLLSNTEYYYIQVNVTKANLNSAMDQVKNMNENIEKIVSRIED